jgi:hypothetical protein
MPEGLTQTKTPTFSEIRPEIDRNGGRLHFGMVAGFTSENPAGINRNPHIVSFNTAEGWSRVVTTEIAAELQRRWAAGEAIPPSLQHLLEMAIR